MNKTVQKFEVNGTMAFPVTIHVEATSLEDAMVYANRVLNDKELLKIEVDCEMADGKKPLIIADENISINWEKANQK